MKRRRHPVPVEMKSLYQAELAKFRKERELRRKIRALERELQDAMIDLEERIVTEREKLAERCNVAPDTPIDTRRMKWMAPSDPRKPDSVPEVLDFSKDETEAGEEDEEEVSNAA